MRERWLDVLNCLKYTYEWVYQVSTDSINVSWCFVFDLCYSLLVSLGKHSGQSFERLFDSLSLEGAALIELKPNLIGESFSILSLDHDSVLKINLVGNNDTRKLLIAILLSYTIVPLPQQMESVLVGNIIYQDH